MKAVINMRIVSIIILFFIVSCQADSIKSDHITTGSLKQEVLVDTPGMILKPGPIENSGGIEYVWLVDFEKKTKRRNPLFKQEYLNVDTLIKGLNKMYPNIILSIIKIDGDTLYTEIKDSEYFAERIGSYTNVINKICQYFINLTVVNAEGIKQIV